jgi:hypothetical protein
MTHKIGSKSSIGKQKAGMLLLFESSIGKQKAGMLLLFELIVHSFA